MLFHETIKSLPSISPYFIIISCALSHKMIKCMAYMVKCPDKKPDRFSNLLIHFLKIYLRPQGETGTIASGAPSL